LKIIKMVGATRHNANPQIMVITTRENKLALLKRKKRCAVLKWTWYYFGGRCKLRIIDEC